MKKRKIELLCPAKNLEWGKAAVNCGADAVYIGAERFGARMQAGNSIKDIEHLAAYAHKFGARVYVTINTVLHNDELKNVEKLIFDLHKAGADAIIFQDMALFEMSLPPIGLIASTQTHNYQPEKIKFLDELGVNRIILARELSLAQIVKINKLVKNAQLEFFIHGALCVCFSGQCYMSSSIGASSAGKNTNRSANRGQCAQPCRLKFTFFDHRKREIEKNKHLLSIKDLNHEENLLALINAGISSLKIEGRLKDISYVKNVTWFYRQKLDRILESQNFEKSSHGQTSCTFTPDINRTFNRGYTSYFLHKKQSPAKLNTPPKSVGMYLGNVKQVDKHGFEIDTKETISTGDGICFFISDDKLAGMNVSKVKNNRIITNDTDNIKPQMAVFRNHDHAFLSTLQGDCCSRKISITIKADQTPDGLKIEALDKYGTTIVKNFALTEIPAKDKIQSHKTFEKQFKKTGNTIFKIKDFKISHSFNLFVPIKQINQIRRDVLDCLEKQRNKNLPQMSFKIAENCILFPQKELDYRANITNTLAKDFYKKRGVKTIEDGLDITQAYSGKTVMTCKYCIGRELNLCGQINTPKPWFLKTGNTEFKVYFDCKNCLMHIVKG